MAGRPLALGVAILLALSGAAAESPETELVSAFLTSIKGRLGSPGGEQSFRSEARVLMAALGDAAARASTALVDRREILRRGREALTSGLSAEIGDSAAKAFVESAAKEVRQARIDGLERGIICWCPEESWTRTLAGCAQGCAEMQKSLVRQWIDEGSTDSEIVDRMVSHPNGDPRVRATPAAEGSNWVGYLFPAVLALVALALLILALRRMSRGSAALANTPAAAAPSSSSADLDSAIGKRIEQELKEMED